MKNVLTIGEAMGLLIAEETGPLESVEHFSRHVCGAELNYAVGMARLGNNVSYISKVGIDPFGRCIVNFLKENNIHEQYVWTDDDHMTGFQMKEKVVEGDPFVANIRKHTAFSHFQPAENERMPYAYGYWLRKDRLRRPSPSSGIPSYGRHRSRHIVRGCYFLSEN